jgi:hypothetical protein
MLSQINVTKPQLQILMPGDLIQNKVKTKM